VPALPVPEREWVETAPADNAEELLGEMLDLHGEGLARIAAALAGTPGVWDALARDPVVAGMLLVHGLHPVPIEERVALALERVRPYLASHGGDVELLGLDDGVARLRLQGSCNGCAASASTLELAIERALEEEAPDLLGLEVEGAVEGARAPSKLLPLVSSAAWRDVEAAPAPGELALVSPGLLVANVAGTLLAYRDSCAGCGGSLAGGDLDDGALACPACGRQFSLPLAGRLLGSEDLQLEPLPLLETEGRVQVAVA
jgi:Fe-S cluster biogenesis protein NfuA/nitrite reductase/ring-hydroxylating ferredoxin subunit